MSIEVSKLVKQAPLEKGHKSILLAMADYASADGSKVFPGTARLARDTGYTPRWIYKLRADLIAMGLLIETRPSTPVSPAHYRIDLDVVRQLTDGGELSSPVAAASPPKPGHAPPVKSVPTPPEAGSPNPLTEPSVEPPQNVGDRIDEEVENAVRQAIDRGTSIKNLDRYREKIRENIESRFETERHEAVRSSAMQSEIDACPLCNHGGVVAWEVPGDTPLSDKCTHNQDHYAGLEVITL